MLLTLEVRDFVIVEHVTLEFGHGLTVLTGETGAGKSILVDALALVLGGRADSGCVRAGAERTEISAVFSLEDVLAPPGEHAAGAAESTDAGGTGAARSASTGWDETDNDLAEDADASDLGAANWLAQQGFPDEDGQVLVRRSIDANGRSRCWINGRAATQAQLRALGTGLLDIHGQHAHQSLLRPRAQRALLDAFAGAAAQAATVSQAWRVWQGHRRALAEFDLRLTAQMEQRDALQREESDLAAAALPAEAWLELQQEHARLAHAHSLLSAAQMGVDSLADGDADVLATLNGLVQRLGELEGIDATLTAPRELIEGAAISLNEAVHELRRYAHRVEADPERLLAVEEQLQRILAVARRYRLQPDGLHERLLTVRAAIAGLQDGLSQAALVEACAKAEKTYRLEAAALSTRRRKAAAEVGKTVTASIRSLAMGDGVFSVALKPLAAGSADGDEDIEFGLAAYPGQSPGALAKIASGGELSRVSLALQTALSQVARVPTLVFDEVDTGIGGGVAEIVGRLLYDVAARCQVMCVTHLPQVAAWADHHLLVSKARDVGAPVSRIDPLDAAARVEEVARMLGGIKLTETTRQHARELLAARPAR